LDREGKLRFKHLFSFLYPNAEVDEVLNAIEQL
ncbi:MAG TPA: alkyl hydroperoxide reductase, partial [Cyanobacteria bacterium UBA12227]|nr:alkyl hydroperoxide reductase [Cyanobacteria bacterium UBA12227]